MVLIGGVFCYWCVISLSFIGFWMSFELFFDVQFSNITARDNNLFYVTNYGLFSRKNTTSTQTQKDALLK